MKKIPNTSIINLLYHEVSEIQFSSGFQTRNNIYYTHTPSEFQKMAETLVHDNFLSDLLIEDIDIELPQQTLLITFDDGGKSAMESSEILEKNGGKGHYFITTGFIGKSGFLSEAEIKSLVAKKHLIGSHSHTHPMIFRSLTYQKMMEEWRTSKKILEDIIGKEVVSCSIPGGDADKKTYESAMESGFRFIFNSEPDASVYKMGDAYILGRFSIEKNINLDTFQKITHSKNHNFLKNKRRLKSTLKKLIFPVHQYIQNNKKL